MDKEFKAVAVKMLRGPGRRLGEHSARLQESNRENTKKQTEMRN